MARSPACPMLIAQHHHVRAARDSLPEFAIMNKYGNKPLNCNSAEPPIGIEPMTYALREGLQLSTAVQAVTSALLARLLVPHVSGVVQGRC